jgi:hypothetical protein
LKEHPCNWKEYEGKDKKPVSLQCLPPLVTGKSENPLCFKNVEKLSIEYVNKNHTGHAY